jgi:hypothetical protein
VGRSWQFQLRIYRAMRVHRTSYRFIITLGCRRARMIKGDDIDGRYLQGIGVERSGRDTTFHTSVWRITTLCR